MSTIGKARRLSRMFDKKSGRMFCVPLDHGMQVGAIQGLNNPEQLINQIVEAEVDSVIINPGMVARYGHLLDGGPAIIYRIDQTTMWRTGTKTGYPDTHTRAVTTVEEAVQVGAEAVITYLFTCNNNPIEESKSFEICAQVASECRKWGMVHIIEAMAAKGGFASAGDPEVVAMNCRIAGELGADIIKTDWCDQAKFKEIAAQSLAPVAVAGGPACNSTSELIDFAEMAIKSGAKGLMFGRNIFQNPDVPAILKTLKNIVHSGESSA